MIELEECDLLMAERWLPREDTAHTLLAEIFAEAREGHLSLSTDRQLPSTVCQEVHSREEEVVQPVVLYRGSYYLNRHWKAESGFMREWQRIRSQEVELLPDPELEDSLLTAQREAILKAWQAPLTIITGGPGTGKSYTSRRLIQAFRTVCPEAEIALAAPTGKAASNLQGNLSLDRSAQTLHSLLSKKRRLSADLILVDESSMIDVEMFFRLFSCVKRGARLVLVGDPNQLPPVEAGRLFADLVAAESCVVRLQRCMRAEESSLIDFADAIQQGSLAKSYRGVVRRSLRAPREIAREAITAWEKGAVGEADPERLLQHLSGFRLLSLVRKGCYGVESMNNLCREGSRAAPLPILITANDHQQKLYNGEMGVLLGDEAYFWGGEGEVRRFPKLLLPPFELAFCLSVHKSQGSEFRHVTLLLPEGSDRFGREGLYTAATRAKRSLTIYSAKGELERVVKRRRLFRSGIG